MVSPFRTKPFHDSVVSAARRLPSHRMDNFTAFRPSAEKTKDVATTKILDTCAWYSASPQSPHNGTNIESNQVAFGFFLAYTRWNMIFCNSPRIQHSGQIKHTHMLHVLPFRNWRRTFAGPWRVVAEIRWCKLNAFLRRVKNVPFPFPLQTPISAHTAEGVNDFTVCWKW